MFNFLRLLVFLLILGFKQELTNYMYEYTRDLIDAVVFARDTLDLNEGAQKLLNLSKTHNIGNFSDKRVIFS